MIDEFVSLVNPVLFEPPFPPEGAAALFEIARLKNLEADEKEGKLVAAEEVKQVWDNHNANCKAKLLSIPAKLALELSGIEEPELIQVRLTEVIDEALIELGGAN